MKTILLIDDEPQLLSTLSEILKRSGHKVIPMPDAEFALSFLREGTSIDLIITDLQLPGMSGFDLISLFKEFMPAVPIIVLTGYGSVESYIQTRSRGIFEYINKPVRASELRRIANVALNCQVVGNSNLSAP